ncbi:MAG TPA: hypothetical protein VFY31_07915, partial [Macromonas sp.]|nr:hypothetical protein [Macromonas sp.]
WLDAGQGGQRSVVPRIGRQGDLLSFHDRPSVEPMGLPALGAGPYRPQNTPFMTFLLAIYIN